MLFDKTLSRLIKKYDTSGPRYTSYPPAPLFSPSFGSAEYDEAIRRTETESRASDLSLYVHFPFCDTLCYFCGCTTVITRNRQLLSEYLRCLDDEMDLLARLLNPHRRVTQMHWGGGTPTYLSPAQIEELGLSIQEKFRFNPDAEVSVEIDPRDLTYHHLKMLREVGFNRISIGVQDFDLHVQRAVNRLQTEFMTRQVIDWGRSLGFSGINVDLIYGLPLQTPESFGRTLKKIAEISPDRIAAYNFAYVPWMKKHQKLIHEEDLPSPDTKIDLLTLTIRELSDAGYVYIGMDHFAKEDDELTIARREGTLHRNFQGYSTRAGSDLYGLGMSSIGHFGHYYAQNAKTLPEYFEAVRSGSFATKVGYTMTFDDKVHKHVIMQLMCNLVLKKTDVEEAYGIEFDTYFEKALELLEPLAHDGLVNMLPRSLEVTEIGRLFLRNIAMCFDAYVNQTPSTRPLYSRTV